MNMPGVNKHVVKGSKRQSRRDKKGIKVTYISSPMKVKASASNFRALVQELTGQDSNVAETFAEANGAECVHHKGSAQQWSSDGFLPEPTWLKPDYSELQYSRSLMEPLNLQNDLLSFDMF